MATKGRFSLSTVVPVLLIVVLVAIGSFLAAHTPHAEPAQADRIKEKAQQVGGLVKAGRASGLDPQPIMKRMNAAQELMRSGEFEQAEKLVDEALARNRLMKRSACLRDRASFSRVFS